ncbi:MAG TPA: hypothetical protein VM029_08150 [Opitutaceae bacterium]|nr:hypothetical protein [Opitutaceae bacterium]
MLRPALLLSFLLGALGASAAQEVEVGSVRFTNVRASNGAPGNWLEADIALNVHAATGAAGQMVGRVKVALLVGFELPGAPGSERRVEHFRAEAECVALEPGRADIRFYLPPEIVKRDQLHGDPKFWTVELTAGGRAVPASKASAAPALANAEQRRSFQSRAATAAVANDGILQPQYLTPFVNDYARATPTFVRREGR